MKKTVELALVVFAISFLASCASFNGVVLPEIIPRAEKTFTVNHEGTIEVIGQGHMIVQPKHWLYVQCGRWGGCYMRCRGKTNSCKKIATDSKLDVNYIFSQAGP